MKKLIIGLVSTVVAVPVVAAVAITILVDPNDYKPELESIVSENTGREFTIAGDIGLTVFPWLGFEVNGVSLGNATGFSEKPMMQIGHAEARLKFLPLLTGQLEIGSVALADVAVVAGVTKGGEPSWADMMSADAETEAPSEEVEASTLPSFSLEAFTLENASLTWLDKATNSTTIIEPFSLNLGEVAPNQPFSVNAALDLQQGSGGTLMTVEASLSGMAEIDTDNEQVRISQLSIEADAEMPGLKPLNLELAAIANAALDGSSVAISSLKGSANSLDFEGSLTASELLAVPNIKASLALEVLNVDDFILPTEVSEEAAATTSDTAALNATPVDVSALNSMNATVDVTAKAFEASGLKATDFVLKASVNKGVLNVPTMTLNLYEGALNAAAKVNAAQTPAKFEWQHSLSAVNAEPLQDDVMGSAYITGTAAMNTAITTRGATVGALKAALNGNGDLRFEDGALKGINIAGVLRKAFAAFKKQPEPENNTEVLDTDFSAATASFTFTNGVMSNQDLLVESPLIRITGAGTVNLVDETVDYGVKPVIVASLEGQGGSSLDELDGLPIPVRCTGAMAEPNCRTDFSGLLKAQANEKLAAEKARAEEKLEEKKAEVKAEAKAKLEDKAKDLLKKWR